MQRQTLLIGTAPLATYPADASEVSRNAASVRRTSKGGACLERAIMFSACSLEGYGVVAEIPAGACRARASPQKIGKLT